MSTNLMAFLICFCAIFGIYVFINIFKRKISLQHSLMWFFYAILMIVALLNQTVINYLTKLFGFEVTSNMIFFFGFSILIIICFYITKLISKEKEKIIILTQELAILKKELRDKNESYKKNISEF